MRKQPCWIPLYLTLLLTAIFSQVSLAANANESENHKIVNGIDIYMGILPSEMIVGHPKGHPENEMHGGITTGSNHVHLLVSLFDVATGKRITDAKVTGTIEEVGLAGQTKELEPMKISDTISYGNYFDLNGQGTYRAILKIRRPNITSVTEVEFTHQHFKSEPPLSGFVK